MGKVLHTFGDSHSVSPAWNSVDFIKIEQHHIGSYTMANFGLQKLKLLNIKDFDVKENDIVCFCFGEIDCRAHIPKMDILEQNNMMDYLVNNYFEAINLNRKQYKDLKVLVFNIVPTLNVTETFLLEFPKHIGQSFVGSAIRRKEVTLYMNKIIKELCVINGYLFIDVFNNYCDADGFINNDLKDNTVHIKDGKYLNEFLKNNLWN